MQNTYQYYSTSSLAVEEAGSAITGIQAYINDQGVRMWTTEGPVRSCTQDEAATAERWWQSEWDIPGGIPFIKS